MAPLSKLPTPVELIWSTYRGPGAVTFDKVPPAMEVLTGGPLNTPFRGKATVTATFTEPGSYVLTSPPTTSPARAAPASCAAGPRRS